MKYCRECGARFEFDGAFCPHDGSPLLLCRRSESMQAERGRTGRTSQPFSVVSVVEGSERSGARVDDVHHASAAEPVGVTRRTVAIGSGSLAGPRSPTASGPVSASSGSALRSPRFAAPDHRARDRGSVDVVEKQEGGTAGDAVVGGKQPRSAARRLAASREGGWPVLGVASVAGALAALTAVMAMRWAEGEARPTGPAVNAGWDAVRATENEGVSSVDAEPRSPSEGRRGDLGSETVANQVTPPGGTSTARGGGVVPAETEVTRRSEHHRSEATAEPDRLPRIGPQQPGTSATRSPAAIRRQETEHSNKDNKRTHTRDGADVGRGTGPSVRPPKRSRPGTEPQVLPLEPPLELKDPFAGK